MKNLKVAILVFGVLGVVGLFVPQQGFSMFSFLKLAGMGYLIPILGGFLVAAVMGGMALAKPPMQKWQAGLALVGFAAAGIRLKIWEAFKDLGDMFKSIPMLLIFVGIVGGIIVSVLALAKEER